MSKEITLRFTVVRDPPIPWQQIPPYIYDIAIDETRRYCADDTEAILADVANLAQLIMKRCNPFSQSLFVNMIYCGADRQLSYTVGKAMFAEMDRHPGFRARKHRPFGLNVDCVTGEDK